MIASIIILLWRLFAWRKTDAKEQNGEFAEEDKCSATEMLSNGTQASDDARCQTEFKMHPEYRVTVNLDEDKPKFTVHKPGVIGYTKKNSESNKQDENENETDEVALDEDRLQSEGVVKESADESRSQPYSNEWTQLDYSFGENSDASEALNAAGTNAFEHAYNAGVENSQRMRRSYDAEGERVTESRSAVSQLQAEPRLEEPSSDLDDLQRPEDRQGALQHTSATTVDYDSRTTQKGAEKKTDSEDGRTYADQKTPAGENALNDSLDKARRQLTYGGQNVEEITEAKTQGTQSRRGRGLEMREHADRGGTRSQLDTERAEYILTTSKLARKELNGTAVNQSVIEQADDSETDGRLMTVSKQVGSEEQSLEGKDIESGDLEGYCVVETHRSAGKSSRDSPKGGSASKLRSSVENGLERGELSTNRSLESSLEMTGDFDREKSEYSRSIPPMFSSTPDQTERTSGSVERTERVNKEQNAKDAHDGLTVADSGSLTSTDEQHKRQLPKIPETNDISSVEDDFESVYRQNRTPLKRWSVDSGAGSSQLRRLGGSLDEKRATTPPSRFVSRRATESPSDSWWLAQTASEDSEATSSLDRSQGDLEELELPSVKRLAEKFSAMERSVKLEKAKNRPRRRLDKRLYVSLDESPAYSGREDRSLDDSPISIDKFISMPSDFPLVDQSLSPNSGLSLVREKRESKKSPPDSTTRRSSRSSPSPTGWP